LAKNIISVENLRKSFGSKILIADATFGIHEGDKIGFIGVNGCGKSTLLKMLINLETPDRGRIIFRSGIRASYLAQNPNLDPELSVFEQIYYSNKKEFKLLRKYYQVIQQLKYSETKELLKTQQELVHKLDSSNGWEIETKAKAFLTRLGFDDLNKKTGLLSGGQKRRLDLARILMDEPDVLLLDEPTNHLDIDTIEWFQDYLIDYNGVIIFVTHDRYFVDGVSNRIMELDQSKLRFYDGNYSFFLKRKELEQVDLQRKETRRTAQLRKEIKWLRRGAKARTSKPKDHLDRVKELLDKSYLTRDKELELSFKSQRMGKTILEVKDVSKSYGNNSLFSHFSHTFQKMERIGIIGPNGCGKTTLLKLITGEEKPDQGNVKIGLNTKFAYFKQNVEEFKQDVSVLDFVRESADNIRTRDGTLHSASEMLERFLFDKKMQQNLVSSLSGGEKKRLYLLKSLIFGSNFIILDEPTNDLDIKTLEILEDYLDVFRGCILIVSHDRYFLDRITDQLFIFEKTGIVKFPGNYSDYLLVNKFRNQIEIEKNKKKPTSKQKIKPAQNKISYKEKRELEKLEKRITELEYRQQEISLIIEKKASVLSAEDFRTISQEQETLRKELEKISDRWLELAERNN